MGADNSYPEYTMSLPEVHIGQIKQEIAMMTHDGHIVDFDELIFAEALDYIMTKYLRHQDEKNRRKMET